MENLYRKYGGFVLRRCLALLGDEADAREVMQDTFVAYWQRYGNVESPGGLLYRIATSRCLNRIRDRRAETAGREDEELLHEIASSDCLETALLSRDFLERAFGREEESTRVMAVLHFYDGLTLEEVAAEVGLSV